MDGTAEWMQYASPVHPKYFVRVSSVFLIAAFVLFAELLVYLMNVETSKRSLIREIMMSAFISLFAGFGLCFAIMWSGNYL